MKQSPREILDAAARTHVPDNLNLYPRIATQLERKTIMQTLRARPAFAILLALFFLAVLSGVVYAIGRFSGFIPGFGFTSDSSVVYTLVEPVEVAREDITLRVVQAVSDIQKFAVTIEQDGRPFQDAFAFPHARILLTDGSEMPLLYGSREDSNAGDVLITLEFDPLPPGTEQLTLQYEFVDKNGVALWRADLNLLLRPLRANEIIPAISSPESPLASQTYGGLTLVLENIAPASDKTILQVALRFEQPGTMLNSDWNVTLTGEDGAIYPLQQVMSDSNNQVKTYQTVPFKGGETLTLALTVFPDPHNLPLSVDYSPNSPAFTFDPGQNPQTGQTWQMDETLQAGEFSLRVTRAALTAPNTLTFTLHAGPSVTGVMFYSDKASGASGGVPTLDGMFTSEMTFDRVPAEPFDIHLMRVYYTVQGDWKITWQAPIAPQGVTIGGTATPVPTPALYASATPAFSDPQWLELTRLAQAFDAPFQQGPGWIHYITETETNPGAGKTYPPPYLTSEQWLEIDAEGYVTRTIWTDRDAIGNILQQAVTIGDYFVNFTTGDSGYLGGERYRFSAGSIVQDLNVAAQYNTAVAIEEVLCDGGAPCYLVTFLDTFDSPAQNPGEAQPFAGSGRQVWLDKQTGQMIRTRSFWRLQDGTERIDHTNTILLVEKVANPPKDILDILEKVIVP